MGKGFEQFGMSVAGNAANGLIGGVLGQVFAGANDRRQLRQQGKLSEQQMGFDKQMTDYNYSKQLQMWKDTNYSSQVAELEKAGLNPGLLYGMSGGGGVTTGSGGGASVSSAKAPAGGGEAIAGMGMMQSGLMAAQIANINADTKLKEADAANKPLQGENIKAGTELTRLQSEIAQTAASVSRQTIKEQMRVWEQTVEKNDKEIEAAGLANKLSRETIEDQKRLLKFEVASEATKAALNKAITENTDQDTKKKAQEIIESEQRIKAMASTVMQGWENVWTNRQNSSTNEQNANGLNKEDWDFLNKIAPDLLIPLKGGKK